jgi:hypothetical protein
MSAMSQHFEYNGIVDARHSEEVRKPWSRSELATGGLCV